VLAATALIACDRSDERASYAGWLGSVGYRVVEAGSPAAAIDAQRRRVFSLMLADVPPSATDAIGFIQSALALNPVGTLLMLANGDAQEVGPTLVRAGATIFLVRPVARERLLALLGPMTADHQQLAATARRREDVTTRYEFLGIIAHSPRMVDVLDRVGRVASCDATVLLTGESGAGKERVARAIHANSPRSRGPLVVLNCAALPEALLESELFGYRRGSFTGATMDREGLVTAADGGTLFLDEAADLPLALQPKLLRFLEDRTYLPIGARATARADVRVIAATNADLRRRVQTGAFREDLYYRLAAFPIHIPPLRERPEDVAALAYHFVREFAIRNASPVAGLSREAVDYLVTRPWRGNVRELRNAIERAVILSDGGLLTSDDFYDADLGVRARGGSAPASRAGAGTSETEGEDRARLVTALDRSGQNVAAAARALGLSYPTLRYRMRKHRLR
jgi:DNA-binding NtrC family response regulator